MTVVNHDARNQYVATNGQTIFNYTFEITDQDNLKVYQRAGSAEPDDAADLLTITTDYTVTGVNGENGGTIVLVSGATTGDIITIQGDAPAVRDTSFTPGGVIQAQNLNLEFDNDVLIYQTILAILNNLVPMYPRSAVVDDFDRILPLLGPGESWIMNASGNEIIAGVAGGSAADILAELASHDPGEGASLIGLNPSGTVQDLANIKFILQVANATAPNAQALGALATGILKNTTTTGVLSISAAISSIDALTTVANQMLYTTGADTYATTTLTPFARTLLDDTTAAIAAATLQVLPLAGGTMTGAIDMGGFKITNLDDPTSNQDAATKIYVDTFLAGTFLPLAGGTMSGEINMGNNKITNLATPTVSTDAATKGYVDTGSFLPLAGGTMAGEINMGSNKIVSLLDPTNPQDAATLAYVSAQLANYLPLAGGTMALNTGTINMNSSKITNLEDPTNSQDAATKAYVDLVAVGLAVQPAVRLATTGALTATYANGASGVGATLTNSGAMAALSLDGVATATNDRVLIKDQASALENGIYVVTNIGSGAVNWILTRATDYDQPSEISPGDLVIVNEGTTYTGTSFIETDTVSTVGTDAINFSQFTFSATAVLLKANNLSDVANASTSRTNLGLAIGTDVQAYDATLQSLSALGTAADRIAYTTGIDTWAEAPITAFGRSLIDDADATAGRATLGVVIGTNVQAYDATLQSLSALGTVADRIAYTTGVDTWAETPLTAFARTLLDDATAAAARTTLGVASDQNPFICQGRLTLTTGVPVTTANVTAATTLYFALYKGNQISLYDGSSAWTTLTFTELSIAVPATTATMYDVFCYNNAGTATLELTAWTDILNRATALTKQDGIYVKTGATTRRYLGSFCTTGVSGQTEDSTANRLVFNYYNRCLRPMSVNESTDSWNYSTATVRQARASTANQVNFVVGVSEDAVKCNVNAMMSRATATGNSSTLIGLDSTTAAVSGASSGQSGATGATDGTLRNNNASYNGLIAIGYHSLVWLECGPGSGAATTTWYGDNGGVTTQSGIQAEMWG